MKLIVNGEPKEVPNGTSIALLLRHLCITAPRLAVEVNADVIVKVHHETYFLNEGDRVEIVTLVGGG